MLRQPEDGLRHKGNKLGHSPKERDIMDKARETALKALMEIDTKEGYSNLVLKQSLGASGLDSRDRAFVTELVYGTVARKITLDWVISRFSETRLTKLSKWVLQILRMGAYQLLFLDRVPPSAACNTSVELAKKYARASAGFVNAILRNISRKISEIRVDEAGTGSRVKDLSIRYSFPEYLTEEWLSMYGAEFTEKLLASLLERPPLTVRVNTLKTSRDDLTAELKSEGIDSQPGLFLDEALELKNVPDISKTKSFINGKMTVQDESSMLAAKILDPKPGERILDVCAAPGGKTTHIAQMMKNDGHILAWDIHPHKIDLINDNAKRLGITIIDAKQTDALMPAHEAVDRFDRVLVDAPCSGTGIIRRKPDIKWQRKQDDFGNLIEVQRKILYNASRYVIPGGTLVYSTCSVDERENTGVAMEFLKENPEYEAEALELYLPDPLKGKDGCRRGMLSLYPHIDRTDGFFIARFRRRK